jgi:DNA-binding MarR family transcriptional regulator
VSAYTDLFAALVKTEIVVWNGLEEHISSATGLSLATYLALQSIGSHAAGTRVQDISDELLITVGASSKLVDRLERDGHAERRPHPVDRRSSIVLLTESGAERLAAAGAAAESYLGDALGATLREDQATVLTAQLVALRMLTKGESS